jgi:hypothetical protein
MTAIPRNTAGVSNATQQRYSHRNEYCTANDKHQPPANAHSTLPFLSVPKCAQGRPAEHEREGADGARPIVRLGHAPCPGSDRLVGRLRARRACRTSERQTKSQAVLPARARSAGPRPSPAVAARQPAPDQHLKREATARSALVPFYHGVRDRGVTAGADCRLGERGSANRDRCSHECCGFWCVRRRRRDASPPGHAVRRSSSWSLTACAARQSRCAAWTPKRRLGHAHVLGGEKAVLG